MKKLVSTNFIFLLCILHTTIISSTNDLDAFEFNDYLFNDNSSITSTHPMTAESISHRIIKKKYYPGFITDFDDSDEDEANYKNKRKKATKHLKDMYRKTPKKLVFCTPEQKQYAIESKKSLSTLAKELNVDKSTISRWITKSHAESNN